ncbi:MAG TPA: hypothetical protein VH420_00545 [Gaiellaceae bacterium]
MSGHGVRRAWATVAVLAVVFAGLAATQATPAGPPSAVATGFYCGPPPEQSTPARFAQALDAGFTFSMPPCTDDTGYTVAQNRQILDAAQVAGMPVMVWDKRMQQALDDPAARPQLLDAIVNAYSSHPALWGYFVYDEVPPELIGATAAVVAGLRARDPRHPAYVSLFPDYYPPIPDYDQYVRDFVRQIRPAAIIYDYYPFFADGSDDSNGFFRNLNSIRRAALRSSTPFWFFAQLTQLPGLRRASESEKRWQALQVLAYGARGLMFFTYWSNVTPNFPEPGVIDPRSGLPTTHYPEVRRVNRQVRAFGQALASARSRAVFHNGPLAPTAVTRPPRAPIYFPGRAPITTGLFDSARYRYAMLASRDYHASVSTGVVLSFGARRPQRFDSASGRWVTVRPARVRAHSLTVRLTLPPAGGALFRTRKPAPAGLPGAEAVFGRVRSGVGHWHLVDSRGGTYELRAAAWSECPSGFARVGRLQLADGFWLCARRDLRRRAFYVGNIVAGSATYYRVRSGTVRRLASRPQFSCGRRSRLIGRLANRNGFWLCLGR